VNPAQVDNQAIIDEDPHVVVAPEIEYLTRLVREIEMHL
jgi:hypothetical protein